ncbi:beta/gamma crystallin family protein [Scytonema tolypothrichoides VB-61278]|nr:beta/gamma crystallin family protein [Scytonema tolypothrichoides VB-61278]
MKDNQHEQLFTELDNEVAATCSGGYVDLYENGPFAPGRVATVFAPVGFGDRDLRNSNFNDKTSSIFISAGERWEFFRDINYQGPSRILGPGSYPVLPRDTGFPNDWVSSLRRVA